MSERQRPEDLLTPDQLKGMTEIWARGSRIIQPGFCKTCGHHRTLEPDGRCLWCHGREGKVKARQIDERPHEDSRNCWCGPKQDAKAPSVWIHRRPVQ